CGQAIPARGRTPQIAARERETEFLLWTGLAARTGLPATAAKSLSFAVASSIVRPLLSQIPCLTGESNEQVHPISFSLRVAHRPRYSGRFLAGQVSVLHHSVRHTHPRQSVQRRDRALHL